MPYPFQQLGGATSMRPGGGGFQEQQGQAGPMVGQSTGTWFTQNAPQNTGVAGGPMAGSSGTPQYGPGSQFPGLAALGISGDPNDPATIRAFIRNRYMATNNGKEPSESDYKYWQDNITRVGGLGTGEYWYGKMTDPSGTGANAGGGGGGGGFGASDVMQQDPGYQFALQQGIDAVQRGAAAKGTLLTGGTQKELANYAAGLASQRYGDIFNRNLSLADLGLNAASRAAGLGSSYGQQAGQTLTQGGQAAAAGSINQGNIWGNTLGNLGSLGAYYAGGGGQYPSQQGNPGLVQGYGLPGGFGELPPGIYG